jgi:hypothetical protein
LEALKLQVFTAGPDAGTIQIRNDRPESFEIEYYEILSASSLNSVDWTSLDDQEGDNEFEGWEESAGNDAGLLSEYRLFSTLSVPPSATLSLGKAFDVGSPEDLKFFIGLSDGTYLRGVVEYISDGLTGDFNRDSAVDAADYVAWRKGLGATHIENDFNLWRTNFSQTVGGGGFDVASVPEPPTLILILMAVALMDWLWKTSRPGAVARVTEQKIDAIASVQNVVAGVAVTLVVAQFAENFIDTCVTTDSVGASSAVDYIVAFSALDVVVVRVAIDRVVAGAAEDAIAAGSAIESVVASTSEYLFSGIASVNDVVALPASMVT